MKEIVAASDLTTGLFVCELDRPWLDSPFLMQGFLIEDEEVLLQLQSLCRFVYVDRSRSVGEHFRAPEAEDVTSSVGRSLRNAIVHDEDAGAAEGVARMPDFLEIMRLIRTGNLEKLPSVSELGAVTRSETHLGTPDSDDPFGRGFSAEGAKAARNPGGLERLLNPLRGLFGRSASRRLGEPENLDEFSDEMIRRARLRQAETVPVEQELVRVVPSFARTQMVLEQVIDDVRGNLNPDLGKLREGVEDMVRSVARNPDALLWLTRLKRTDQYTYDHALDVSVHAMIFARSLGLGEETTAALGIAGLMQDVGKIRLPQRLLQKNTRLTPLEYEIFKTHVDFSIAIVKEGAGCNEMILQIVRRHHERLDGSGYPEGLRGEALGMNAEISGLVDSYCAMTRERGYGELYTSQQALEQLIGMRDRVFRDTLVDQFVQCIGIYPVGSLVELNSGEVAVVIGQNRVRRLKPRVMVLLAPDKSPNAHPPILDLLYDPPAPDGEPYAVVRALPPNAYGIDPQEFYLL